MMWSGMSSACSDVFGACVFKGWWVFVRERWLEVGWPFRAGRTREGVRVLVPRGFGDVSERGSVCRHNDVRESRSQFWDAQEGAPE